MLIFVSLGRHTPRANRSSHTGASLTLTKGLPAKTGCKLMGFQRCRPSMFASFSRASSSAGVTPQSAFSSSTDSQRLGCAQSSFDCMVSGRPRSFSQ